MSRPRLLYVPIATRFEAERVIALADWADIATFDAPGAGENRELESRGVAGVVEAALARLDGLDWQRCGVICDSHSQAAAVDLVMSHPERVEGVYVGHAAARYRLGGDRPAMVPPVHEAAQQLLETDYRSFARAVTQMTQGLVDDAYVERWIATVPQPVASDILGDLAERQPELVARLRGADLPVVLGKHEGCVMWTPESFEDACRALPEATKIVSDGIPTQDPRFLEAVRALSSGAGAAG